MEITQAAILSIEITVDDNITEYMEIYRSGDKLRIRLEGGRVYNSVTLETKITMPSLHGIKLSGGSQADITGFSSSHDLSLSLSGGSGVKGDIKATNADFDLSGGSQIYLEGLAEDLDINGSGGSHLELDDFSVNNADTELSGGGSATVHVKGTLDVDLSGGSRVRFVGQPAPGDIELTGDSTVSKKE